MDFCEKFIEVEDSSGKLRYELKSIIYATSDHFNSMLINDDETFLYDGLKKKGGFGNITIENEIEENRIVYPLKRGKSYFNNLMYVLVGKNK